MSYWLAVVCLLLLVVLPFLLPAMSTALFSQEGFSWSRRQRLGLLLLMVFVLLCWSVLYRYLGNGQDVLIQRDLQRLPAEVMYTESPQWQVLVGQITERLQQRPDNTGYLRILAEEASARERWHEAAAYYRRLSMLSGNDPAVETMVLTARFMAAGRQIDASLRADMEALLSVDPAQASVRGMLGMAAFEAGQWQEAITQWQQALRYLPANDPVATMLSQGIVRARAQLGEALPALQVSIPRPENIESGADTGVFVFLSREGVRMPLAARKVPLSSLPGELALGAADVLGGQDWPVTEGRLQVTARLVSGGAVGDAALWEARSDWFDAAVWPARLALSPVSAANSEKSPPK